MTRVVSSLRRSSKHFLFFPFCCRLQTASSVEATLSLATRVIRGVENIFGIPGLESPCVSNFKILMSQLIGLGPQNSVKGRIGKKNTYKIT